MEQAWSSSEQPGGSFGLAERLAMVHEQLHKWDKTVLKKASNKVKQVQRELESIARDVLSHENMKR